MLPGGLRERKPHTCSAALNDDTKFIFILVFERRQEVIHCCSLEKHARARTTPTQLPHRPRTVPAPALLFFQLELPS